MGIAIKTRLLGSQSDEKLLELARDRAETAFEVLARRHRRLLLRRCRQLCLSEEIAQEVVRRALSEAQSGIEAGAKPRELQPWLHGIAERIAVEELRNAGLLPPQEAGRASLGAVAGSAEETVAGAPTPSEVLALRGALAAMSADRSREAIVVHRGNGNKVKVVAEDAFELADDAVRGLLGRARRGISALTPPPLLAWAMGRAAQGGASGERMAELGASGGAAGVAGLALKGGIVAITAGVAITGAVIAQSKGPRSPAVRRRGASAVRAAGAAGATAGPLAGAVDARASAAAGVAGAHGSKRAAPGRASATAQSSATPVSTETPSNGSGQRVASTTPASQSSGAAGASGTGAAGASGSGAAASGAASEQSQPAGSSGESAGHGAGVGVQVSVGSGSGQQTSGGSGAAGTAGSSSTSEASKGVGVGISVSLEPLGSVGVHVSLP